MTMDKGETEPTSAAIKQVKKLSHLRVWYGWCRLNKIRKKRAISVIFENCFSLRNEISLKRFQNTVYWRYQTDEEATDASYSNRMFTEWSIFLDEKPYNGDLEEALNKNFIADGNHVSQEERTEIMKKLKERFMLDYPGYAPPINRQLKLF